MLANLCLLFHPHQKESWYSLTTLMQPAPRHSAGEIADLYATSTVGRWGECAGRAGWAGWAGWARLELEATEVPAVVEHGSSTVQAAFKVRRERARESESEREREIELEIELEIEIDR
jgi:hypothetical protein